MQSIINTRRRALVLAGLALAASGAQAAKADTTDYVMSDFESGQLSTPLFGFWYTFTDRNSATVVDTIFGNSTLTTFDESGQPLQDSLGFPDKRTFPKGYSEASTMALRFGYVLGDRKLSCGGTCTYEPYVGFGLGFSTQSDTVDLTGSTGIAFWAKADSKTVVMNVSVTTRDTTTGAADYSKRLVIDTAWKQYIIPLVAGPDFTQPAWSPRKPFDPRVVKGMGFGINRGENDSTPTNAVTIDDLTILDWQWVPPPPPPDPIDPNPVVRMAAPGDFRLTVLREGARARVRLPERYARLRGTLEAVDAGGRIKASKPFQPGSGEIVLEVGLSGKTYYRVRTTGR